MENAKISNTGIERFAGLAAVLGGLLSVPIAALVYDSTDLLKSVVARVAVFSFTAILIVAGFKSLKFKNLLVVTQIVGWILIVAAAILAGIACAEQNHVLPLITLAAAALLHRLVARPVLSKITAAGLALFSAYLFFQILFRGGDWIENLVFMPLIVFLLCVFAAKYLMQNAVQI